MTQGAPGHQDAHASRPTRRRKALHDGTMFARNTWLIRQAFDVLGGQGLAIIEYGRSVPMT